jgi:hypothetical protein
VIFLDTGFQLIAATAELSCGLADALLDVARAFHTTPAADAARFHHIGPAVARRTPVCRINVDALRLHRQTPEAPGGAMVERAVVMRTAWRGMRAMSVSRCLQCSSDFAGRWCRNRLTWIRQNLPVSGFIGFR